MQTVFEDARQRSVEMHDMFSNMENNTCGMLNDVEHRMNERESHLMSEIESRTFRQQEAIQACQESLRTQVAVMQTQVTSQREEMESLMIQQQKMMQTQTIQQREEIQSQVSEMERRLNDKFFSYAEATRPAHSTLPVISNVESDVNESVYGVTEASLRSDPRFDGSFGVLKVSEPPVEIVAYSCADAAASEIGYNTTQLPFPPRMNE